jgi:uncharacterized membrane protein YjgN (DUF898 family)
MLLLEQWVRASAKLDMDNPIHAAICETVTEVLTGGLGDNWSQVRMAAIVLSRVLIKEYLSQHPMENPKPVHAVVHPRMCLHWFYLAQGVNLHSHRT